MDKLLKAIVGIGVGAVLEEGVFISAGFGKDRESGELETHFQVSTWKDRHRHRMSLAGEGEVVRVDTDTYTEYEDCIVVKESSDG